MLTYNSSIFVHARNTTGRQALVPGSKVSFIYETDEKGGKAVEVAVEEMAEPIVVDEGPREIGTVKASLSAFPSRSLSLTQFCNSPCNDSPVER